MRPTKTKGDCDTCFHINENKIISQIENVLKAIQIPKHIVLDIHEEFRQSSEKVYSDQQIQSQKIRSKIQIIDDKSKQARDFLLSNVMT